MELGEWDAAITDLNQMIEQDPLAYQAYLKRAESASAYRA